MSEVVVMRKSWFFFPTFGESRCGAWLAGYQKSPGYIPQAMNQDAMKAIYSPRAHSCLQSCLSSHPSDTQEGEAILVQYSLQRKFLSSSSHFSAMLSGIRLAIRLNLYENACACHASDV